jgi:hypothetical protein
VVVEVAIVVAVAVPEKLIVMAPLHQKRFWPEAVVVVAVSVLVVAVYLFRAALCKLIFLLH